MKKRSTTRILDDLALHVLPAAKQYYSFLEYISFPPQ